MEKTQQEDNFHEDIHVQNKVQTDKIESQTLKLNIVEHKILQTKQLKSNQKQSKIPQIIPPIQHLPQSKQLTQQQILQQQLLQIKKLTRQKKRINKSKITYDNNKIFNDDEPIILQQYKEKVKQLKPYNLQENLVIEVKSKQRTIKLSSKKDQLIPFMINIKTKQLTEEQEDQRSPIDLICVIDVSGSMANNNKIDLVKKALQNLLEIISPKDRLCLIEFDSNSNRLTPLLKNNKLNAEIFKEVINKLAGGGGTNIAAGMNLAFKVIKERKIANPITSIFLLTDGLDSGAHLRTKTLLVENQLLQQNFTINCFGFGNDHDEDLLNSISKYKDGNFYFVQQLNTVDLCFAEALGGLMSVVALDVNIYVKNTTLKPFQGICIKQTFGDIWNQLGMTSGYKINISQMFAGVEKGFVGQIIIPKSIINVNDKQRTLCILEADITAKDKTGKIEFKKEVKLVVHLINQQEQIGSEVEEDGEVMENYYRVKGALAIQKAVDFGSHGNQEQGKKQIQAVIAEIKQKKNLNIKKSTMQYLFSSEQYFSNQFNPINKKKLVSNTKQMMEQKAGDRQSQFSNNVQTKMIAIMKSMKQQ